VREIPAAAGPLAGVALAPAWALRFDLHGLHRFGSFLNCLSWKKSCSPAVKTNSPPQSTQVKSRSTNSIHFPPWCENATSLQPRSFARQRSVKPGSVDQVPVLPGGNSFGFAGQTLNFKLSPGPARPGEVGVGRADWLEANCSTRNNRPSRVMRNSVRAKPISVVSAANPVPYGSSCDCVCELALLSRASSRRASDRRSDALLP